LIDALLADYQKPDDLLGKNGILEQLTKRVVKRSLSTSRDDPPSGTRKARQSVNADGNTRNGTSNSISKLNLL
jgi:putative transposase